MAKQKIEIEVDVPDGWDIARQSVRNEILPILPVERGCSKQLVCGLILRKIEPVRESRWRIVYSPTSSATAYYWKTLADARTALNAADASTARFERVDFENGVPVSVTLEPNGLAGAEGGA